MSNGRLDSIYRNRKARRDTLNESWSKYRVSETAKDFWEAIKLYTKVRADRYSAPIRGWFRKIKSSWDEVLDDVREVLS